jgi:hypothetical protein
MNENIGKLRFVRGKHVKRVIYSLLCERFVLINWEILLSGNILKWQHIS